MLAWFIAQFLKVLIFFAMHKKINFERFFGSGGMPSSHAAFVCALALSTGRIEGFATTYFAITLGFAMVVMYDASGVRRETGKQAVIINYLMDRIEEKTGYRDDILKELIGHTPVEVIIGAILGTVIAAVLT